MTIEFEGEVWYWRGPAPFYFVTVPARWAGEIKALSSAVTYGWGMIPVRAQIGNTQWTTTMFPKDGSYVLPLKDAVRKAESIDEGEIVTATLEIVKNR